MQAKCRYNADVFGHPGGSSLDYLCDVKFKYHKEGFFHLIPLGNKIVITLTSTPKAKSFPVEVFGKFNKELEKTHYYADEPLIGRKIMLDNFIPYEFLLEEKLRLIERTATVVATYKYEGAVESNYVPKGGVSDFLLCMTKPVRGRNVEIDTSIKPRSREEFLKFAPDFALKLIQPLHTLVQQATKPKLSDLQRKLQHKDWIIRKKAV